MPSPRDARNARGEGERQRRKRNAAMGFALAGLVALLYAVTVVKLGG